MQKEVKNLFKDKTILFTPLNWGLGHAARCIPLIRLAVNHGHKVVIGSDGSALDFLRALFPTLDIIPLPSYGVSYPFKSMMLNAIVSAPKALKAKRAEHKAVVQVAAKYNIDLIISDNRYGCFHKNCESIFISHQLDIQYPNSLFKRIINIQNKLWIQKFDRLWVPDYADRKLTGILTNKKIHPNTQFIGPQTIHRPMDLKKVYDVCVLLSGPEPQRSFLEESLLGIFSTQKDLEVLFVAGKMDGHHKSLPNIIYKSYVIGEELTQILNASSLLICRSGYSTIMDISGLDLPAIFIPTPGQTEQEYLAALHSKNDMYDHLNQNMLQRDLIKMIKQKLS